MSIHVVQAAVAQAINYDISCTLGSAPTVGNTIVVAIWAASYNIGSISCNDTAGNTYTLNATQGNQGGTGVYLFSAPVTSTASYNTITIIEVNTTTAGAEIVVMEVAGLGATPTMDATSNDMGNATTEDAGSMTTTQAPAFLVAVMGSEDTGSSIATDPSSSGWTSVAEQWAYSSPGYPMGQVCYLVSSSAGTFGPQWTTPGSTGNWVALQAAFTAGGSSAVAADQQSFLLMHP